VASNLPQLHVARYDWVFLLAVTSQMETFGLVMQQNDDNLLMLKQLNVN